MLMPRKLDIRDESGTTMVELLVGMAMGMVVLAGLTMLLIVVLHGNARVDARVEATDNARIAVTRITEELHSACTVHGAVPVQESSTADKLVFRHAAPGQALDPQPETVETVIAYEPAAETLTQADYGEDGSETKRSLLTHVAPGSQGGIFTYSGYGTGGFESWTSAFSPTEDRPEEIILVTVELTGNPRSTPVSDAGAAATVQDSATLRLTPPSFEPGAAVKPCE